MDVLMPQLGETVAEGKIVKWFKQAGDKVAAGDNLFEIETDKTSMEVPATSAGVLAEIRVPVGAVAPVGAVVAVIADAAPRRAVRSRSRPRRRQRPRPCPAAIAAAFGSAEARSAAPMPRRRAACRCRKPRRSASSPQCRPAATHPSRRRRPRTVVHARTVPRSAHARAQLRPRAPAIRRHGDTARPPPRRRSRHRSRARFRVRPARPHSRPRHRHGDRRRRGAWPAAPRPAAAASRVVPLARQGQGALRARLLRGSRARRHAPHDRRPPHRGQADHPAFLSHRRLRDGRAARGPRAGQREGQRKGPTASRSTGSRSTIS